MEKFVENLSEAGSLLKKADHLICVAFPMTGDKRILISALEKLKESVAKCINAVLQYEYLFKRIRLYRDSRLNLRTFEDKCARRYGVDESEIGLIKRLFEIYQLHKSSSMVFIKNENIFIMADRGIPIKISFEDVKSFLNLAKNVFGKVEFRIREN